MQPNNNNPANFISGLPNDSFGGGQPAPAPQQQPQGQPQYQAPPDFSQYAAPIQGDQNGFGSFVPSQQGTPDIFGDGSQGQQGQPQQGGQQQPWVPQPPQQQPQQGQYPYQQPAPGTVPAQQPQPYQPQYQPYQPPAQQSDQPPAWAQELTQMLQQTQQQQQQGQQQGQQDWKPKTWNDVADRAREAAREVLTEQQQQEQNRKAQEEAQVNQIMAEIDNQINQLTFSGQMPPIVNNADPNDQGRAYRRELIGLANATGSTNMFQLNQNLIAAHRAGMIFDAQSGQFTQVNGKAYTPAGQNTPIAGGGTNGASAPSGQLPPVSQLRRASMGELMQGLTNEVSQYIG